MGHSENGTKTVRDNTEVSTFVLNPLFKEQTGTRDTQDARRLEKLNSFLIFQVNGCIFQVNTMELNSVSCFRQSIKK